ncbi:MAG: IS110 family transposase, partial [Armatimonadota bacterium]|nr:IS110 family transposase [Armatimonadota bacterium]
MRIIGAMDVHRGQITFKFQDRDRGVRRGRTPCDRESVRKWLEDLGGGDGGHIALEATTGWRFGAEEIQGVGYTAHLAEPAEAGARGWPKGRA